MVPLKQGSRGGRGVFVLGWWGGVKGEIGMYYVTPHGIPTKNMVVPPTIVGYFSGRMLGIQQGGRG